MRHAMSHVGTSLDRIRAAYRALRRFDTITDQTPAAFVAVLDRPDLRTSRGNNVRLSCRATPAISVHLAQLRAAWEILPEPLRAKTYLVLSVERGSRPGR